MIGDPQSSAEDGVAFFRALRHSRLLPEGEVRAIEEEYHASPNRTLTELFVQTGKLTRYQFDRLGDGEPQGLVVGPYRVLDELGRGGGGCVYKACHTVMNRLVALKVIDPRYTKGRSAREAFRREVAASTRLTHPNIVQVYDANECDGVFYIAMELVAAPTLHQHVIERGPLSPPVASAALLQLAHALAHAHKSGLVHRDIKPSNIMLLPETQSRELVKVLDFGLARLHPVGDHRVTTIHCPEGAAIGTPAFMSPEQIRNFHSTDIRSDLYSLGCTFYFALTGRLPFEGPTTSVTLLMQLNREPASLRSLCPSVPGGLAHIVHRLMAKNPDERYQTPNELIDALNALVLSTEQADAAPATQIAVVPPHHAIEEHRPEPPPSPTPSAVRQVAPDLTSNSTLSRLWEQWCEALAIASRDEASPYSEAKYKCLHRELMGALVAAGKSAGESSVGYLDWVTSHVEPWITLDSIYRLDRQTRAELFRTCRALGLKLFPSPTPTRPARAGWMTLAVGFAFALVAYLIVWSWPYWSVDWPSYSELPTPPTAVAVVLLVPMIALMVIVALRKETRV